MLTQPQKAIVSTIQRLRRRGEPLNVTAVKRRQPELIRAVYAVKPFWGWKQALNATGINDAGIKIELQDKIKCALCGKSYRNLATHLIRRHEVRPEEYLMDKK